MCPWFSVLLCARKRVWLAWRYYVELQAHSSTAVVVPFLAEHKSNQFSWPPVAGSKQSSKLLHWLTMTMKLVKTHTLTAFYLLVFEPVNNTRKRTKMSRQSAASSAGRQLIDFVPTRTSTKVHSCFLVHMKLFIQYPSIHHNYQRATSM